MSESNTPLLHIRLLGGFSLHNNDQAVTLQSPRLHSLLAYLALNADVAHSRQQLAFLFWPESTEEQALTNLRKLIFNLRQQLSMIDELLSLDHQSIQWRSHAGVWLDVHALEHLLLESRERPLESNVLIRIAELFRGELLPECYEDWIKPLRQKLKREVQTAIGRLTTILEGQHAVDDALRYAQRLVELEPLDEEGYRCLMRLHRLKGNRAAMARAYQECQRIIEGELGVELSVETRQLYAQLTSEVTSIGKAVTLDLIPLVGRTTEWKSLQASWRRTLQGNAQLVAIMGEAGIGKTRLAEELLRWTTYAGAVSVRTRSYAVQGALTYAPIIELLRTPSMRSRYTKMPDLWLVEVARLLPELLEEFPHLAALPPLHEDWQRQRFWEALARAIRGYRDQPMLILLDDLQWCDAETLAWLQYLLVSNAQLRLLVVGTVRDDEVAVDHPFARLQLELQRNGQFTHIALNVLDAGESVALARQVAQEQISERQVEQTLSDAQGNPLYIVESIRSQLLPAGEGAQKQDGAPSAAFLQGSSQPETRLPPKVYATIVHRLRQLTPLAQEVACLAAVVGRSFDFELLLAASMKDEQLLVDALDELWRRRIIRSQAGGYDFSHDRLRDVAYESLSPIRQQRLHLRIAEAIEALYQSSLDDVSWQVANHFEHAGNVQRAIPYIRRAAVVAQRIYAHEEAIRILRHGLDLMANERRSTANDLLQLELLAHLAFLLVETTGTASSEVRAVYEQARNIDATVMYTPATFTLWHGMTSYYRVHGEYETTALLAQRLLQQAEESQNPKHLVAAHFELGATAYMQAALMQACSHLEQSEQLCIVHQSYARPHSLLAEVLWLLGYPDQAFQKLNDNLAAMRDTATPYDIVAVLGTSIEIRLLAALHDGIEEDLVVFRNYVQKYGYAQHETWSRFLLGWSLSAAQGLPMVMEMENGLRSFIALGGRSRVTRFLALIAEEYLKLNLLENAESLWSEAMDYMETQAELFWEPALYLLKGKLLLKLGGGLSEAEEWFLRAFQTAKTHQSRMLELRAAVALCRLWQQQGRTAQAYSLLAETYSWFTEGFETPDLVEAHELMRELSV